MNFLKNCTMSNLVSIAVPTSKKEIKIHIESVKETLLNGETDPLQNARTLKALEELINGLRKDPDIRDSIMEEALLYGQKRFDAYGAEYQIKEVGVKYDFDKCNCAELDEINKNIKALTNRKKEIEKTLKALPQGGLADPETGEMLLPPTKTSTTSVTVTLKK